MVILTRKLNVVLCGTHLSKEAVPNVLKLAELVKEPVALVFVSPKNWALLF